MYDYAVLCEPCSPGGSLPGPRSLERKGRPTTRDLWDSMGWNYVYGNSIFNGFYRLMQGRRKEFFKGGSF